MPLPFSKISIHVSTQVAGGGVREEGEGVVGFSNFSVLHSRFNGEMLSLYNIHVI